MTSLTKEPRELSSNTAYFKSRTQPNSRLRKFRASFLSSKGSAGATPLSLYAKVVLPEYEDEETIDESNSEEFNRYEKQIENEWIAENIVDFIQELSLSYTIFTTDNEPWEHLLDNPERFWNNGYPLGVTYRWKDKETGESLLLKVDEYVERVIDWVEECVLDEDIFPTDEEALFKDDFQEKHAKKLMSRMLRVFNIILYNPTLSGLDGPEPSEVSKNFQKLTARFVAFGVHWELLYEEELDCIKEYLNNIKMVFERTRQLFFKKQKVLSSLVGAIEEEEKCDEKYFFMFLTEEQAMRKLRLNKCDLDKLIDIGVKEAWIKIVQRGDERRLCYTHVRKLPPQFL